MPISDMGISGRQPHKILKRNQNASSAAPRTRGRAPARGGGRGGLSLHAAVASLDDGLETKAR